MDYSTPGFEGMHVWKEVKTFSMQNYKQLKTIFFILINSYVVHNSKSKKMHEK